MLTGTATVFRYEALQAVKEARAKGVLPGAPYIYDVRVLTEDNELTLALLHLGYKIRSPKGCKLTTEVMSTWTDLAKQRLRWKRGALENLFDYGITRVTIEYWLRQLLSLIGVMVIVIYLASIIVSLLITGLVTIHPLWMAITAIFIVERVITVRSRGITQMIISAILVVEMIYDVFLQGVQAWAFFQAALKTERKWT